MSETCYKHALNMPITTTCPQCQIADLTAQLSELRKNVRLHLIHHEHGCAYLGYPEDYEEVAK